MTSQSPLHIALADGDFAYVLCDKLKALETEESMELLELLKPFSLCGSLDVTTVKSECNSLGHPEWYEPGGEDDKARRIGKKKEMPRGLFEAGFK